MNKQDLKAAMLKNEHTKVSVLEAQINKFVANTNRLNDDVVDLDDKSHDEQLNVDHQILDKQVHNHEAHQQQLAKMPFNPSTKVELGAVVKVNDNYVVISVADGSFKYDNKDFLAISTDAPLYKCMEGKNVGESCSFNDSEFKINAIY